MFETNETFSREYVGIQCSPPSWQVNSLFLRNGTQLENLCYHLWSSASHEKKQNHKARPGCLKTKAENFLETGLWVHGAEEKMPEVTPKEMTEIVPKLGPLCGPWPSRHSDLVDRETQRWVKGVTVSRALSTSSTRAYEVLQTLWH